MAPSYFESDGRAVNVTLVATVPGNGEPIYGEGWLGLAEGSGNSGETIAVTIDRREHQFLFPTALTVIKGDTIYVTLASAPTNNVPDAAYSTTSGAGKKALCKATAAGDTVSFSGKLLVTGILLPEGV